MFKKAKQKIVLSTLAILGTVLMGTLGMIYLANYLSTVSQNFQVLERQMEILMSDPKATMGDKADIVDGDEVLQEGEMEQEPFGVDGGGLPDGQSGQSDSAETDNATEADNATDDSTVQPEGLIDQLTPPYGNKRGQGKIQKTLEVGTFYEIRLLKDGTAEVILNGANGLYSDEELIELAGEVSTKTKGKTGDLLYLVKEKDGITFVCFMDNTIFSDNFTRLFLFILLFGLIAMIAMTFISNYIANRIISPMEESYQKQKQFTADAGHELKTPVAVVATNLELLKREIGDNKWLDNINYENERMQVLITQLLELARNENRELERAETNLSHLVQGAILPYEAAAFEKNILIEGEIAEGVTAKVNDKSMEQFVAILLDNAISHAKFKEGELGMVKVKLYESRGYAVLSVSNPGDEIPENEQKKLFERFYRTDTSREFNGHYGLGLAIAKSLALANHGTIEVSCGEGLVTFTGRFGEQ